MLKHQTLDHQRITRADWGKDAINQPSLTSPPRSKQLPLHAYSDLYGKWIKNSPGYMTMCIFQNGVWMIPASHASGPHAHHPAVTLHEGNNESGPVLGSKSCCLSSRLKSVQICPAGGLKIVWTLVCGDQEGDANDAVCLLSFLLLSSVFSLSVECAVWNQLTGRASVGMNSTVWSLDGAVGQGFTLSLTQRYIFVGLHLTSQVGC